MIKRGKSETINHTFYNNEVVADAGTVTVTVANQDGDAIYSGSTTKTGDVYSFVLPAQADLGVLDIAWNGTLLDENTTTEIIGSYYFEIYELKELLVTKGLEKTYDNEFLRGIRDQVTDVFESVAKMSFVERRKTVRATVNNGDAYMPIVALQDVLTVDGTAFTGSFTSYGRVSGLSGSSATVTYEHGLDGGVTAEAKGMALDLAVWLTGAQTRTTPDNAQSITDPNGNTYRLALVGTRDVQVAVPQVDAFLKRIRFEMPGVA